MATTEASSRSNNGSADSYIGSLISVISKSELRYEGVLFSINAAESSIGLRNVRSFGTEGRKRDGPQLPPSDKVYEYILFRGSDIKDLQVKSSPPVEIIAPSYTDPAIIESHLSQGMATPGGFPSTTTGARQDLSFQAPQAGLPNSTFQGNFSFQPSVNSVSWSSPYPPPMTDSSSFRMPIYLQGFYGASDGLQTPPHSLLQPSPQLSIPTSMPQTMQYPVMSASLPTRASNLPTVPFSVSPPSLLPPFSTGQLNSNLILAPQPSALVSDTSTTLMSNKALPQVSHTAVLSSNLPFGSPSNSVPDKRDFSTSVPEKIEQIPGSIMYNAGFEGELSGAGTSGSFLNKGLAPQLVRPNQLLQPGPTVNQTLQTSPTLKKSLQSGPTPNQTLQSGPTLNQLLQPGPSLNLFLQPGPIPNQLLQPGPTPNQVLQSGPRPSQLLQPGITTSSANYSSESAQKDVEVVQVSSIEQSLPTSTSSLPPLLPLPSPLDRKVSGDSSYARYNNRVGHDRRRGNGGLRQVTRFTEDFDFGAMNEKFNKDEIWGDLGKSDATQENGHSSQDDDAGTSNFENKPGYVKDDFFDSLSCNASDHGSRGGRTNFSEQRKLDVETFGNYARHQGGNGYGRGGRGYGGGGCRYGGDGRGYGGRGRGYGGDGHGYGGDNRGYGGSGRGYGGRSYAYSSGRIWGHHTT